MIGGVSFAEYPDVSIGFALVESGTEGPKDLAVSFLSYPPTGTPWTEAQAFSIAEQYLPPDANPDGGLYVYRVQGIFMEYRRRYQSNALAAALPESDRFYCGEDDPDAPEEPGTFFVKVDPTYDEGKEIRMVEVTTQGC